MSENLSDLLKATEKSNKTAEDNLRNEAELRDLRRAQLEKARLHSLGLAEGSDVQQGYEKMRNIEKTLIAPLNIVTAKISTYKAMNTAHQYDELSNAMQASGFGKIDILSEISTEKFMDNLDIAVKDAVGQDKVANFGINIEQDYTSGFISGIDTDGKKFQLDMNKLVFNADGYGQTNAKDYYKAFVDSHYANEMTALKNTKNLNAFISQNENLRNLNLLNMNSSQIEKELKKLNNNTGMFANATKDGGKINEHQQKLIEQIAKIKKTSETIEKSKSTETKSKRNIKRTLSKPFAGSDLVTGYNFMSQGINIISRTISTPRKLAESRRISQKASLQKRMMSKNENVKRRATRDFEKLYGKDGKITKREERKNSKKKNSRKSRKQETKRLRKANKKVSKAMNIAPGKRKLSLGQRLKSFSRSIIKTMIKLLISLITGIINFLIFIFTSLLPIIGGLLMALMPIIFVIGIIAVIVSVFVTEEIDIANNLAAASLERQMYEDIKEWNPDLTDVDIAGIMGNIAYESDFRPFQYTDDEATGTTYRGLCNWSEYEQEWINENAQLLPSTIDKIKKENEKNNDASDDVVIPEDLGDAFDYSNDYALDIQKNKIRYTCMMLDNVAGKDFSTPSEAAKKYAKYVGTINIEKGRYISPSSIPARQKKAEEEYRLIQGWNLKHMLNPEPQNEPSINFLQHPFAFLQASLRDPENPEYFDGWDFNNTSENEWNVAFVKYCLARSKMANVYDIPIDKLNNAYDLIDIAKSQNHWIGGNSIPRNSASSYIVDGDKNSSKYNKLKPGYILLFHDEDGLYPNADKWKIGIFVDFIDDPTYGKLLYVIEGDSYGESGALDGYGDYGYVHEGLDQGSMIEVSSDKRNVVGHLYYLAYNSNTGYAEAVETLPNYSSTIEDPEANNISVRYHLYGAYAWYNDAVHDTSLAIK